MSFLKTGTSIEPSTDKALIKRCKVDYELTVQWWRYIGWALVCTGFSFYVRLLYELKALRIYVNI